MGSGAGVARAPPTRPLRMRIVVWRSFFNFLDWVTIGQLGASRVVLCDLGDEEGGTGGDEDTSAVKFIVARDRTR